MNMCASERNISSTFLTVFKKYAYILYWNRKKVENQGEGKSSRLPYYWEKKRRKRSYFLLKTLLSKKKTFTCRVYELFLRGISKSGTWILAFRNVKYSRTLGILKIRTIARKINRYYNYLLRFIVGYIISR